MIKNSMFYLIPPYALLVCSYSLTMSSPFRRTFKTLIFSCSTQQLAPQVLAPKKLSHQTFNDTEEKFSSLMLNAIKARLLFLQLDDQFSIKARKNADKPFRVDWKTRTIECHLDKIRKMEPETFDSSLDRELKISIKRNTAS